MSGAAIRTFFAIELSEAARAAAAGVQDELRGAPGGDTVRWVPPEGLHVTLRFLGNIEPARVGSLARAVEAQVAGVAPFELVLGAAALFPTPRRPRVVALEVGPREPLVELAAAVERGVVAEGFEPEERPFRAHLSLGRVRGSRAPAPRGLAAHAAWEVREAVLFRSQLDRSGARYSPLERVPLGAGEISITPPS